MKYPRRQLILAMAAIWLTTACASIGPPNAPSLELPKPVTDLRASRKGDEVTLTWTIPKRTMERQSVRYLGTTQICRNVLAEPSAENQGADQGKEQEEDPEEDQEKDRGTNQGATNQPALAAKVCGTIMGSVPAPAGFREVHKDETPKGAKRISATFSDTLPSAIENANPAGFANYRVEVRNEAGRSAGLSNAARVPLVPTVLPFANFAAQTKAQGVLLSWQCPRESAKTNGVHYLFRIYRRTMNNAPETQITETKPAAIKIAEVDATDCVAAVREPKTATTFLDSSIDWGATYFYRATVVSMITGATEPVEVEGDDTPEVKIFAHDIFPPAVPIGLQAVYSGPGQQPFIDLIWAPVTDSDLAGYNVYRHEEGAAPIRISAELLITPAYRDSTVAAGKTYFYSVTAVDRQGNESARSEETSETPPRLNDR
jgi:hypothetical protein